MIASSGSGVPVRAWERVYQNGQAVPPPAGDNFQPVPGITLPWQGSPRPLVPDAAEGPQANPVQAVKAGKNVRDEIIHQAAAQGVPPAIALAVAHHISGLRQEAGDVTTGAVGVYGLTHPLASALGATDPSDWRQNIKAGLSLLKGVHDQTGSWVAGLGLLGAPEPARSSGLLNPSQVQFAQMIAGASGMSLPVVYSWLHNEQPASTNPQAHGYNWLNLGPGQKFGSLQEAVSATLASMRANGIWGNGSPLQQAQAIQNSQWDGNGHYGYSKIVDALGLFTKPNGLSKSVTSIAAAIHNGSLQLGPGSTGVAWVSAPLPGHETIGQGYGVSGGDSQRIQSVVSFAQNAIGTPYVWGGESKTGYDCSGLVQAAFKAAGISIGRTTWDQYAEGAPVKVKDLEPGDIVFGDWEHDPPSSPTHEALYVGNGEIIVAPHTGTNVQVEPLSVFRGHYLGARRMGQIGNFHYGVDIAAPQGTPVHSMIAGTVQHAGWTGKGGVTVVVRDTQGRLWFYNHLSGVAVKKGQKINAGEALGSVGQTGDATNPHLNIGLQVDGKWVNPTGVVAKAYGAGWGKRAKTNFTIFDYTSAGLGGLDLSGTGTSSLSGGGASGAASPAAFDTNTAGVAPTEPTGQVDAALSPTDGPEPSSAWQQVVNSGSSSPETLALAQQAGAVVPPALDEAVAGPGGSQAPPPQVVGF